MKTFKPVLHLALVLVIASLLGAPSPSVGIPPGPSQVLSDAWLPIAGTVFLPPGPCMPGGVGEDVTLSGMAHVVTKVDLATNSVMIFINSADVTGMGLVTDLSYLAVGAVKTGAPLDPTCTTCVSVSISARFDLVQAGACPTFHGGAPVRGILVFNSDGTLNAEESSLTFGSPTDG